MPFALRKASSQVVNITTLVTIMEESVSAADANRKISQLLRSVRDGKSYVVTVHGKPVAKIVPIAKDDKVTAAARSVLFARLRSQPALDVARWTRDELYDDEP